MGKEFSIDGSVLAEEFTAGSSKLRRHSVQVIGKLMLAQMPENDGLEKMLP